MTEPEIKIVRALLASDAWATVLREIRPMIDQQDAFAYGEREPFNSGKAAACAHGMRLILQRIESLGLRPADNAPPPEEFSEVPGEDRQQLPKRS